MSSKKASTKKKVVKILLAIFITLLIIIIAAGGTVFWYVNNKIGKMNKVDINEDQIGISKNENLSGYRNIAIFGVDSRSDDYGTGHRSDCIIIASINNATHDIKLISVYRDTYMQIEGYGLDKITHAYSYGGPELAIRALNENMDLNIKEFVAVNFDAVVDVVDALGGIEMKITSEEIEHINNNINETSTITGKRSKHITKAGTQMLDGVQAVSYSRIRMTSGGDYKRTERMRDVVTAMLAKLKTKNVSQINNIADKILPQIYTNLSMTDLLSMAPMVASFNVGESVGWPFVTKGITLDRWYSVPTTLKSNVEKLHKEVFNDENYTLQESVEKINDKIIKKTGYNN